MWIFIAHVLSCTVEQFCTEMRLPKMTKKEKPTKKQSRPCCSTYFTARIIQQSLSSDSSASPVDIDKLIGIAGALEYVSKSPTRTKQA
jgi:hypothetical protein